MIRTSPPLHASLLLTVTTLGLIGCAKVKEIVEPPPDPVATSIEITPTTPPAIDAIGDTLRLTARVLDQNNNQISGLSVAWSSDDDATATVAAGTGLVTAVANGMANITATSGTLNASVAVSVTQAPAAISKAGGDSQTAGIGTILASDVIAQVDDRLGTALGANIDVTFTVTSGGGSVDRTSGMTDASGQVTTSWTLGTTSGNQELTAALTADASINTVFSASATAAAPDSIHVEAGDGQSGIINQPLTDSLVAKVIDAFGNGVPGVLVTFAVNSGGGAVSPTSVSTDVNGEAATSWTLGNTNGLQDVTAISTGLKGSPITFSATGSDLSVTSVSPDPMVEGGTATLTGTGFDANSANNTVTVDGVLANVTAATTTTLTIDVPSGDCRPADDVDIVVSVGGGSSPGFPHRRHPSAPLSIAVGEQVIITNPNDFCLQFLPDATGGDEYLIGVGATDDADAAVPYLLTADAGAAMAPAQPILAPAVATRSFGPPLTPAAEAQLNWQLRRDAVEAGVRQWERENLDPAANPQLWTHLTSGTPPMAAARVSAAQVVPNVGDQIMFRVPDIQGNLCNDFTSITTTVRAVGTKGIIVTDNANPTTDSLTIAEINSFSSDFDNTIAAVDETYFGALTDLDTNQRAIMILTQEVNRFGGLAGFVTSVDLLPRSTCAASDFGEIFYGYVPDPNNTTGGGTVSHTGVVNNMLPLIAHEVAHIHQQSRRAAAGNSFMASWEAEGQADLAKEVVGHALFGNAPGNDYGKTTIESPGSTGFGWYEQRFTRLSLYFGWAGGSSTVTGETPEDCSLFGHSGGGVPCLTSYFYGAGWAFHRYINDRFRLTYPGGEEALQRDWVDNDMSSAAGVEDLLGVPFDSLFAQWAAMLYADGRSITGLAPELQMNSWNLANYYGTQHSSLSLTPTSRSWGAFSDAADVRKGSTAYTLLTAGLGQRGAMAIRLRTLADQIMASGDKPQFWVLRTQ